MTSEQRSEVIDSLVKQVVRVTTPSELKSPEEVNALPAIVDALFSGKIQLPFVASSVKVAWTVLISVATYSSFRFEAERCDITMSTVHCIT